MPAFAQEQQSCPPVADSSARQSELMASLKAAPDQASANAIMDDLWRIWTTAPDAKAQDLLDRGMAARESYDFLGSRDILDGLVEYCPDYAEGYNQRAFASFLRGDFNAALYDIDKALELEPNHMGALSGKAMTLMNMGRADEAQQVLRQAVDLDPWLKERGLLTTPQGTEL